MRAIVYNNIDDSNFTYEIGKLRLYFSSEFNLNRFRKGYETYISEENYKLENKYHVNLIANYYLLIAFYKKIEKRGFRIENNITNARVNPNLTFICEL